MGKPQLKEILIIFLLAVLVVGGSWFYAPDSICGFKTDCNRGINPTTNHGWPLQFMTTSLYAGSQIANKNLLLDFLFWFLVISAIWRVVKWLRRKL